MQWSSRIWGALAVLVLAIAGCSGGGISQSTPTAPDGLTTVLLPASPSPFAAASPGGSPSPTPSPSPSPTALLVVE